jgi:hypothetical protein
MLARLAVPTICELGIGSAEIYVWAVAGLIPTVAAIRTIQEKTTFLKTAPQARGELLHYEQWNIDTRSVVRLAGAAFRKGVSSG